MAVGRDLTSGLQRLNIAEATVFVVCNLSTIDIKESMTLGQKIS